MKHYFITAAGTGLGKTFLTSALTSGLRSRGKSVVALKPLISGFDSTAPAKSDTGILLKAQGLELSAHNIDTISPWRFHKPLSPDMAAENEKRVIDFSELVAFSKQKRKADYVLIEGVGGVMSPVGTQHTVLDWMKQLEHKIILVSGSYLGAISHTLTAYAALQWQGLHPHAIVISESENAPVPPERIQLTLRQFLPNDTSVLLMKRGAETATLVDSIV